MSETLHVHLASPHPGRCGADCAYLVDHWLEWKPPRTAPLAMLRCSPDYYDSLDGDSRAMVRRAQRLYTYRPFVYNEHLREIERINFSKPFRQAQPMYGWYTTEGLKPERVMQLCDAHADTWYGGFGGSGNLVGYARLQRFNDYGQLVSILSHRFGRAVMNGMFAYLVDAAGVEWINYLHLESATQGLTDFKRSVGFVEMDVTYEM